METFLASSPYQSEDLYTHLQAGAQLQKQIEDARKNPLVFYKLCFSDDRGEPVSITWFHKEWSEVATGPYKHALICAPRGSTKTTFWAQVLPLWFLGHNQDLRIGIVCGNEQNASKRLIAIRSVIQNNPLYKLIFPHVQLDDDAKNDGLNLSLKRSRQGKDFTIEARGVLSDGTGDRKDLLIFDDVCNYKNTILEPATKPKVTSKVQGDWLNTLNPRDGKAWCIHTPWATDDANDTLRKNNQGKWYYKRYYHGTKANPYQSMFPQLFSEEWLREKHLEIGTLEFARAYWTTLKDGMTQVVRSEWLHTYQGTELTEDTINDGILLISIDPSGGKNSQQKHINADYVGVSVQLVKPNPDGTNTNTPFRVYILDAYQIKLSTAQAVCHIARLYQKWQPDTVLVEAQGLADLHMWLQDKAPHIPVEPVPANQSKQTRLESITPLLEDPRQLVRFNHRIIATSPPPYQVYIPEPNPEQVQAERELRKQLLNFPTKHDDILDATVQGLRYIRQVVIPRIHPTDADEGENNNSQEMEADVKFLEI